MEELKHTKGKQEIYTKVWLRNFKCVDGRTVLKWIVADMWYECRRQNKLILDRAK
jgi:hypothetical protein